MFESFYEMYDPEEQEVIILIRNILGAGYHQNGDFWNMTAISLGMVFCDTGKVHIKEERLEWPVTEEERNSEKGWGRFHRQQICRLRIRRMKEEYAKDLVTFPWCVSEVVKEQEDCPALQAILDEYNKPVIIQDEVLGTLKLNREFGMFEGEITWCGEKVSLMLEVNPENKSTWTRARNAAKKLVADCDTWDKAMRTFAAKALTQLANDWQEDDEDHKNDEPITEEIFAKRLSPSELTVTSGGSFTAYYDDDEMFWGHAVEVCGSLKKGVTSAGIVG